MEGKGLCFCRISESCLLSGSFGWKGINDFYEDYRGVGVEELRDRAVVW